MRRLKDHFIPHAGNDYQPHALQKAALCGMLVLVVLSFAITNLQALLWISSDWLVSAILPGVIIADTNDERTAEALPQLTHSSVLDRAAQMKADDMAANHYFAHYSPEGVSPWYWFGQAGYQFVHAGENLAIHFTDSSEVVEAWMNSPGHRANIMNGNYTEIGIGVAEGVYEGYPTVYVVQLFGTPAAPAASPKPVAMAVESAPAPVPPDVPNPVRVNDVLIAGVEQDSGPTVPSTAPDTAPDPTPLPEAIPEPPAPDAGTRGAVIASATPPAMDEFESVVVDNRGVSAYSDHLATSTVAVPATVEPTAVSTAPTGEPFWALTTQPQLVLQLVYAVIGSLVVAALLLSIFIEIRRQQPLQAAYGAGLLATMWLLLYFHVAITSGATII